jgi:hypothetical protein
LPLALLAPEPVAVPPQVPEPVVQPSPEPAQVLLALALVELNARALSRLVRLRLRHHRFWHPRLHRRLPRWRERRVQKPPTVSREQVHTLLLVT